MAVRNGSQRSDTASQEAAQHRPAHEIRLGRIKATLWANQAEKGPWYNVNLSRHYKDGDDWKSSASFGRDDLLVVAKVADLAHSWIHQALAQPANGSDNSGADDIPS